MEHFVAVAIGAVVIILSLTLVNLAILGFTMKLYTEFFKERVKGRD